MEQKSPGLSSGAYALLTVCVTGAGILYGFLPHVGLVMVADWLAPILELCIAGLLFAVSRSNRALRWPWICFGAGILVYGISDMAWTIATRQFGLEPDGMIVFSIAYTLPNLFLVLGVFSYFRIELRNWNLTQLYVDVAAIALILFNCFWGLFFRAWLADAGGGSVTDFFNYLYVVLDLVGIGLALVLLFTRGIQFATAPLVLVFSGFLLFMASDVLFAWQSSINAYTEHNLSDIGYVLSMTLFGVGALHRLWFPHSIGREGERSPANPPGRFSARQSSGTFRCVSSLFVRRQEGLPTNIRWRPSILVVFLSPLALSIAGRLRDVDLILTLVVFITHGLVSGFLQLAVKSGILLQRERTMTEQLENRVAERTQDLLTANRELDWLANRDPLTGFFNRRHFQTLLEEMLLQAGTEGKVAIFYLDLDRFKGINDAYGHATGDRVLRELAVRMDGLAIPGKVLAHFGADEFILAVPGMDEQEALKETALQLVRIIQMPVELEPWQCVPSASIGIARYPSDAADLDTLLRVADLAMYHAKTQDTPRYAFYSKWFGESFHRRHEIEIALRRARYDEEFSLHFQPQFSSRRRTLVGMEALLRWQSPKLGAVSPAEFIPVAEEAGLILPIGRWVAEKAVSRIGDWNLRYGLSLRMGINLSPKQLEVAGFIDDFGAMMAFERVQPSWIDVEITENTAMQSGTTMEEILTALACLGVSISLDDFGTGYSSLSCIKRFDIDCLKIAKPLIDNVAHDEGDAQIVGAIVMMAKTMRLRTIAEGVEDERQLELLQRIGCDEIQGFLLGRPVPADQFEAMWLPDVDGHL